MAILESGMTPLVFNEFHMDYSASILDYDRYIHDSTTDSSGIALSYSDNLNSSVEGSSFGTMNESSDSSCCDCSVTSEDSGTSGKKKTAGSRKRKSLAPCRSSPLNDPNFRGVTISMENKLINSEWKFVIGAEFSLPPKKKRKFKTYVDSSDEEDINNNYTPIHEEKHCASCSVKKTPLWRDAEDGTPLCNACGIRYKKYKLRCATCWHIPKKDEFHPTCQYCGSFYEYVCPRR